MNLGARIVPYPAPVFSPRPAAGSPCSSSAFDPKGLALRIDGTPAIYTLVSDTYRKTRSRTGRPLALSW